MHVGKKIGQSGQELILAVFFSFFLHASLIALALFIYYMALTPKIKVPPFYQVKLVGLPAESQPVPARETAQPAPKAENKPRESKPRQQPAKKAAPKTATAAIPEFSPRKPKPEKPATEPAEQEPVPSPPSAPAAKTGGKSEGVAVSAGAGSEDFKFPPYLAIIRDKIESHWNPPPGAVQGAKAKIQFTVLRSGRVGEVKLQDSSGNFYFDQAAVRAILLSSPFPPMPEDFYKDFAVFSVDMQEWQ
jgi:TonB family protein